MSEEINENDNQQNENERSPEQDLGMIDRIIQVLVTRFNKWVEKDSTKLEEPNPEHLNYIASQGVDNFDNITNNLQKRFIQFVGEDKSKNEEIITKREEKEEAKEKRREAKEQEKINKAREKITDNYKKTNENFKKECQRLEELQPSAKDSIQSIINSFQKINQDCPNVQLQLPEIDLATLSFQQINSFLQNIDSWKKAVREGIYSLNNKEGKDKQNELKKALRQIKANQKALKKAYNIYYEIMQTGAEKAHLARKQYFVLNKISEEILQNIEEATINSSQNFNVKVKEAQKYIETVNAQEEELNTTFASNNLKIQNLYNQIPNQSRYKGRFTDLYNNFTNEFKALDYNEIQNDLDNLEQFLQDEENNLFKAINQFKEDQKCPLLAWQKHLKNDYKNENKDQNIDETTDEQDVDEQKQQLKNYGLCTSLGLEDLLPKAKEENSSLRKATVWEISKEQKHQLQELLFEQRLKENFLTKSIIEIKEHFSQEDELIEQQKGFNDHISTFANDNLENEAIKINNKINNIHSHRKKLSQKAKTFFNYKKRLIRKFNNFFAYCNLETQSNTNPISTKEIKWQEEMQRYHINNKLLANDNPSFKELSTAKDLNLKNGQTESEVDTYMRIKIAFKGNPSKKVLEIDRMGIFSSENELKKLELLEENKKVQTALDLYTAMQTEKKGWINALDLRTKENFPGYPMNIDFCKHEQKAPINSHHVNVALAKIIHQKRKAGHKRPVKEIIFDFANEVFAFVDSLKKDDVDSNFQAIKKLKGKHKISHNEVINIIENKELFQNALKKEAKEMVYPKKKEVDKNPLVALLGEKDEKVDKLKTEKKPDESKKTEKESKDDKKDSAEDSKKKKDEKKSPWAGIGKDITDEILDKLPGNVDGKIRKAKIVRQAFKAIFGNKSK